MSVSPHPSPADLPGPRSQDFLWGSGIENTFVPQTRPGHRALDEYQLMGHYEHWREDLALARDLGVRALRWGVPWYRIEPLPGEYDWRFTDEVIPYLTEELGIVPIVDLMHYGCPFWLRREFASDDYPRAVAAYAGAFARRYAGRVRWYTPLNEPLVNALFCGKRGLWPPYLRGDAGYVRLILQLTRGIQATAQALREVDPGVVLVHVEATGLARAARTDLEILAVEDQRRGYLVYDLLTGRVDSGHPLFTWLVRSGAGPDELQAIAARPLTLDLLGLNFYPQWSTQQLYVNRRGRLAYRSVEQDGEGFKSLIEDYYQRYRAPILVTETSARGAVEVRSRWLSASVAAVRRLREEGVPVLGYTWFPLFTMIDWRYRFGRRPLATYRLDLGLYTLTPGGWDRGGGERWKPTPLVEQFRGYVADPESAVGPLRTAPSMDGAAAAEPGPRVWE
ncbi:MAG: family 1 glycosylhydrolase [Acidobacteriota bacterium]|nr:family 1 glycosylhydrolase [Acidobacteriota bacterium]